MNIKNLVEGINLLRKAFNDPDGYHIGAEHDAFYVYETDRPLSDEEAQKLIDLGWFQEGISDPSKDFTLEDYDSAESWCAYV